MKPALNQIRIFNGSTNENFKYTYFIIISYKEEWNGDYWVSRRLHPSCQILHFTTEDIMKLSNYVSEKTGRADD
jgi:hypothetical protein